MVDKWVDHSFQHQGLVLLWVVNECKYRLCDVMLLVACGAMEAVCKFSIHCVGPRTHSSMLDASLDNLQLPLLALLSMLVTRLSQDCALCSCGY